MNLQSEWLGRVSYADGLALQEESVKARRSGECGDRLLLLEHDPVYTIGRTRDQSSLRDILRLPHPFFEINRGGQATYHGPGQLVGYPIIDLTERGRDLHAYLRALENLLIEGLDDLGVNASVREGLTGVWIGERKIASIGVGVRHWITMHGFALNIGGDLTPFQHITPCGIANVRITSVEKETGNPNTVEDAAAHFAQVFEGGLHARLPVSANLRPLPVNPVNPENPV